MQKILDRIMTGNRDPNRRRNHNFHHPCICADYWKKNSHSVL